MRKNKTYHVNLLGRNNVAVTSTVQTDNTMFFTSDTEAFINFLTVDEGFIFEQAELTLVNGMDKSAVVRNMDVDESGMSASYEMEGNVIAHHGRWKAQVVFIESGTGEKFTSNYIQLDVYPHLLDGKVERLIDIDGITGNINALTERAKAIIAEVEAIDEQAIADEISASLSTETQRVIDFIETGFAHLYAPKVNLATYDENFKITTEPKNDGIAADDYNYVVLSMPLVAGQEYTLSFDYEKINYKDDHIYIRVNQTSGNIALYSQEISGAKRGYVTFAAKNDANLNSVYVYPSISGTTRGKGLTISRIKLEEGGLSGYVPPRKP
ncbi:hypothetical protein HZY86_01370 [Aerococcaceae bacterium DSM 111020]|nr:hypothetical protein [Aerococcaceae bacterium DSM 111020]